MTTAELSKKIVNTINMDEHAVLPSTSALVHYCCLCSLLLYRMVCYDPYLQLQVVPLRDNAEQTVLDWD